jgi:hypothetical protein
LLSYSSIAQFSNNDNNIKNDKLWTREIEQKLQIQTLILIDKNKKKQKIYPLNLFIRKNFIASINTSLLKTIIYIKSIKKPKKSAEKTPQKIINFLFILYINLT